MLVSSKFAVVSGSSGEPKPSDAIMAATIRLGKELLLQLSCYTYQGYRSVHRAMQEGYWSAFCPYYTPEKRQALRPLTEELLKQPPACDRSPPPPRVEDLAGLTPRLGICRVLL